MLSTIFTLSSFSVFFFWSSPFIKMSKDFFQFEKVRCRFRAVKQSVQMFLTNPRPRLRRHVGQWSRSSRCMHTLWYVLVSAHVPRVRFCSSLSVVQHVFCRLVCFFQLEVGSSKAMSLSTPGKKFQFLMISLNTKNLNPRQYTSVQ